MARAAKGLHAMAQRGGFSKANDVYVDRSADFAHDHPHPHPHRRSEGLPRALAPAVSWPGPRGVVLGAHPAGRQIEDRATQPTGRIEGFIGKLASLRSKAVPLVTIQGAAGLARARAPWPGRLGRSPPLDPPRPLRGWG